MADSLCYRHNHMREVFSDSPSFDYEFYQDLNGKMCAECDGKREEE